MTDGNYINTNSVASFVYFHGLRALERCPHNAEILPESDRFILNTDVPDDSFSHKLLAQLQRFHFSVFSFIFHSWRSTGKFHRAVYHWLILIYR